MPLSKGRKRKPESKIKEQQPSQFQPKKWWTPLRKVVAGFVATIAFFAAAFGCWEVYVDTLPVVSPHGSSSSLILPFVIKNPSSIFEMSDVSFTCQLINATYGGVSIPPHSWGMETLHTNLTGRKSSIQMGVIIASMGVVNFPCDNSGIEDAELSGVPQIVESMRVGIDVDFSTLGVRRHFRSAIFTWIKTPNGYEWLEGDIVR